MKQNYQFEIYKEALARLEKRNQLIIRELHLKHYETALQYATTPPDHIITEFDFNRVKKKYSSSPAIGVV